jgi:hypothetical protein
MIDLMPVGMGQPWLSSDEEILAALPQGFKKGGCYTNAYLFAIIANGLRFGKELLIVKGYAHHPHSEFPWTGHWWCMEETGRVVDPTWKNGALYYVGIETLGVDTMSLREQYDDDDEDIGYFDLEVDQVAPPELAAQLDEHVRGGFIDPLGGSDAVR